MPNPTILARIASLLVVACLVAGAYLVGHCAELSAARRERSAEGLAQSGALTLAPSREET